MPSLKSYIFWITLTFFIGFFIPFASFKTASIVYHRSMPVNGDNQQQELLLSKKEEKINKKSAKTDLLLMIVEINDKDFALRNKNVFLLFVGDIMFDRGVENSIVKRGEGDFSFVFQNAEFIKDADISFGNLEGSISDKGKDLRNLYSFRFKPSIAETLSNSGFDVLSVANNHIGDWGKDAFEDTLLRLANEGIFAIGGGMNAEDASTVKIIEKNNVKIGFLGFSDVGPNWLGATGESSGILIARKDKITSLIQQAIPRVDVLVVSFHFGEEYQTMSTARQKELAREAIDAGAKIVVGHHPHVVQEVENYKNGVIAYSLGNFIFDQNFSEETMQGLALEIILKDAEIVSVKKNTLKINEFFQPQLAD